MILLGGCHCVMVQDEPSHVRTGLLGYRGFTNQGKERQKDLK